LDCAVAGNVDLEDVGDIQPLGDVEVAFLQRIAWEAASQISQVPAYN